MSSRLDQLRHGRTFAVLLGHHLRVPLLRVGIHQGLFEALRTPQSAEELARRQGLAGDLVAAWLRASEAHGLLTQEQDRYAIGDFVRWLLDTPEAPALQALLDQAELTYLPLLSRLPELMKGAERPEFGGGEPAQRAAAASRALERRAVRALARIPGARSARRVLDIGCGQGTYLAALLTHYRDAHGLGIELDPAIAEEARRVLREAEVSRRAEVRVGDFMTLDLPAGSYDLILVNNLLHYFSPVQRGALFQRVLERLGPGGTLAIQTPVASRGRLARTLGSAAVVATFDLFLRAHRNLHGFPELGVVSEELREAGFAEVGEVPIGADRTASYLWARAAGG